MDLMSSVVGDLARLTRLCLALLLEPIRLEIVLVWAVPLPSTFFVVHWTSPNDSLPSFPRNQDFQLLTFYIGFLKCEDWQWPIGGRRLFLRHALDYVLMT